jgi:hypothetical protein
MKRTDFERCPIHGARLKGSPGAYWCPFDGGHTPRLPDPSVDLTDITDWLAICDGCGTKKSVAAISDWLGSDAYLDFNLCPRCEKRVGNQLLHEAAGPAWPRFIKLMTRRDTKEA